jgi:hypothetical protein
MEVALMSLSAQEQQALGFMAEGLADSAPELASLLATFARLTSGEEMPVHEKILVARRRETHGARRLYHCLGFPRAAPLLWLLITVTVVAVALVIGNSAGQGACATSWAAICTSPAPAHSSHPTAHTTAADLAARATAESRLSAAGHADLLSMTARRLRMASTPHRAWLQMTEAADNDS